MKRNRTDDDQRLRELLRRGDPARGGGAPDPQVVARIRRAMLDQNEAHDPSSRPVFLRQAAVAAGVVLILVAGWQIRDLFKEATVGSTAIGRASTSSPIDTRAEKIPSPPMAAAEPAPDASADRESDEEMQVASAEAGSYDLPDHGAAPVGENSAENLQARTLRYTTQGGTQIIWTLDPDLEL